MDPDGKPRLRNTFRRYLLFQLPGLALIAALLSLSVAGSLLSPQLALGLFALWIAKDLALYPILRVGYEDQSPEVGEQLLGAVCSVRIELDPEGWVRVGAELWRARCAREEAPLESDTPVRVTAVNGLVLEVEPVSSRRP